MCAIPEGRGIFPNLTVTENLRMATYTGPHLAELEERAFTRFPRLRSTQAARRHPVGGERRCWRWRVPSTDPKVLLLDELSMGLAPIVVEELYEIVARIAAEDVSILIVEQFAHEVLDVAQTAAIMLHGSIQLTGRPHQIAEELDAAYLGWPNRLGATAVSSPRSSRTCGTGRRSRARAGRSRWCRRSRSGRRGR
jgi:branched-chain amino acid transport system ATP-binding protein